MLNPQLLRHLESVREERDESSSTKMSQWRVAKETSKQPVEHLFSVLEVWILCGAIGWVTVYFAFVPGNNENLLYRCFVVAYWLSATIIVFILKHTLSVEKDSISHIIFSSILNHYQNWSLRRFERQKAEYVMQISHLLGSMAAPMLSTVEQESKMYPILRESKNSLLALIQLLQVQQDFMERIHEALRILQTCSRFVQGSRPFHSLPLTAFRDQVFAVAKSNQNQLATLFPMKTYDEDEMEAVPSVQRMREVRSDTLQLITDVCQSVLLDPSPLCGLLQASIVESKHLSVYLDGLIDSMKKAPQHPESSLDHLLLESRDLQLALVLLDEQRPIAPNDASKAALRLSQGITSRLERLFDDTGSSTENNEESSTSVKVDCGISTVQPGDELVTDESDCLVERNVAETLRCCLTARSQPRSETLVYSTVVAPKERPRRRKKATDNVAQSQTTASPFDFIDELQDRLKALPPRTELDASRLEEEKAAE